MRFGTALAIATLMLIPACGSDSSSEGAGGSTPGSDASTDSSSGGDGATDGASGSGGSAGTGGASGMGGDAATAKCGNGTEDPGEICDDGNTQSGDGCRGDCGSSEECGDGVAEASLDEECDGVDFAGKSQCSEHGFDQGTLGCVSCVVDTSGCTKCGNGDCEAGETQAGCPADCSPITEVDVLFVIDNSSTMGDEQALLAADAQALFEGMNDPVHGMPDLHVGATTTDLGTGQFPLTYCEQAGGDMGAFLSFGCLNPGAANYIVDDAPSGCDVTRDAQGHCTSTTCAAANCADGDFVVDAVSQCPRCRNFTASGPQGALGCMATNMGTYGCGFEQPLEAMYQALDFNLQNSGFLRPDSLLVVVFVTDEDDCSAKTDQLFDNAATGINDPLGPLNSFRCFEFGVTCDVDDRLAQGERNSCEPRDDPNAMLHTMSRYVGLLESLRPQGRLLVTAIAGPTDGGAVTVGRDGYDQPEIQPSCSSTHGGAVPGIRLEAFVQGFHDPADMAWAYTSICEDSYVGALSAIGQGVGDRTF